MLSGLGLIWIRGFLQEPGSRQLEYSTGLAPGKMGIEEGHKVMSVLMSADGSTIRPDDVPCA